MFKITSHGKVYKFDTIEEAEAAASRVFDATGDIVGIEYA